MILTGRIRGYVDRWVYGYVYGYMAIVVGRAGQVERVERIGRVVGKDMVGGKINNSLEL